MIDLSFVENSEQKSRFEKYLFLCGMNSKDYGAKQIKNLTPLEVEESGRTISSKNFKKILKSKKFKTTKGYRSRQNGNNQSVKEKYNFSKPSTKNQFSFYNFYFNALINPKGPNEDILNEFLIKEDKLDEIDWEGNTLLHHYFRYSGKFDNIRLKKNFFNLSNIFVRNFQGKFPEDCQGVNEKIDDSDAINLLRLRDLKGIKGGEGKWFVLV